MNTRLNLNLREKFGLVYHVEANYIAYSDIGQTTIYFATDAHNLNTCKKIVWEEIENMRKNPMNTEQLYHAKNQIKGQLALSEESHLSVMLTMAKSLLDFGRVPSLDEIFKRIDTISAPLIQSLVDQYLPLQKMSTLVYIPKND